MSKQPDKDKLFSGIGRIRFDRILGMTENGDYLVGTTRANLVQIETVRVVSK